MGWEMCELQRNDVKEALSVSQSPVKYASARRRGFKSADVTVTEAVIPSVPRWFPKKKLVRILAPSRTPEHDISQSQCTFQINETKGQWCIESLPPQLLTLRQIPGRQ